MTEYCANASCNRAVLHPPGLCARCLDAGPDKEPWALTAFGFEVNLLNPRPEQIHIADIAWALAGKARYNGHTIKKTRYSVAQHSCLVADRCATLGGSKAELRAALMHDAAESYLPDVHSQLKDYLPGFKTLERRFDEVIATKFGLIPRPAWVKIVDRRIMATERRDLMASNSRPWEHLEGYEPEPSVIDPWSAQRAETEFLLRWTDYGKK